MRQFLLCILWIPSILQADCRVPLGKYETMVSAESFSRLSFSENKMFKLQQIMWTSGQYEYRSGIFYYGTWQCQGDNIKLSFNQENFQATFTPIGANPFGLSEQSKALVFASSTEANKILNTIFSRQLFYQQDIDKDDKKLFIEEKKKENRVGKYFDCNAAETNPSFHQ